MTEGKADAKEKFDTDLLTSALNRLLPNTATAGELSMWAGIAVTAAGLSVRRPALTGLGLSLGGCTFEYDIFDSGLGGKVLMVGLCGASLAYVWWALVGRARCEEE